MFFFLITPIVNPVIDSLRGQKQENTPALFGKLFTSIVGLLITIATIWSFVHLLLGGIQWMTSGGDKGKLEHAQQEIIHSLIGLAIVFGCWSVFLVVMKFFGACTPDANGGCTIVFPSLF